MGWRDMAARYGGWRALLLAAFLVPALSSAGAYDSDSLYDLRHPATLRGVISRIDWSHPHVYIYLYRKNGKRELEEWSLQLDSPNVLTRHGWTGATLKPGDEIACTGGRARNGARTLRCLFIETAEGRRLRS
jgi:hypothetical protein